VKSLIGHTKATAGVASLIKTTKAVYHAVLPPTLISTRPNPRAHFEESPFYVNTEARPWIRASSTHPRRAGVSAFGFGVTNFHVIVEEYTDRYPPVAEPPVPVWPAELFLLRARTAQELATLIEEITAKLNAGAKPALTDLAFTLLQQAEALPSQSPTVALT